MSKHGRLSRAIYASLTAAVVSFTLNSDSDVRAVSDTIWVANRLASVSSIREFDAASGDVVRTVTMAPNSQPGDLASLKGRSTSRRSSVRHPRWPSSTRTRARFSSGSRFRISLPLRPGTGWRPHHVHASVGGNLIAVGLFGTDLVAVIDTRDDSLLGPWDSNIDTINGRVHAGVFSKDGNTLYLANEGANEVVAIDPRTGFIFWRMTVPAVHELVVTHDGKRAYASRRGANKVALIHLEKQTFRERADAEPARHDAVVGQRETADDRSSDLSRPACRRQHNGLHLRPRQSWTRGSDDSCRPSVDVSQREVYVGLVRRIGRSWRQRRVWSSSITGTATRSFRRSRMRGDRTARIARYRRKPVLNARSSRGVTRRATLSRSRSPRPHQSPERSSIQAA